MMTRPDTDGWHGAMTALVTPFRDGNIDWTAVDDLVDHQLDAGMDAIVPCGTTGESPTLTAAETEKLLERVIDRARSRVPAAHGDGSSSRARCRVIAGTGSNSTAEAIRKTKRARQLGADAAMLVAPYYNRPPQEGLFRHYAAVADAVDIPLVLYNVPARTGVNIANDTVVRLRERFPGIVAIKDATGTIDNVAELSARCGITVLCGDDILTWPMMALGAAGVISVIGNLVPGLMRSLVTTAAACDVDAARTHHQTVFDLASGLAKFGPNPIPIKTALAIHDWIAEEFRLPLCPLNPEARASLERVLSRHEIRGPVHA